MNKINRIKELVQVLNTYRNAYYNENNSIISDSEYDKLFDELSELEKETGVIMANSPTITVGYEVKSELEEVKHSHPMLSLDKTKSENDLIKFADDKDCLLSLKMDGLTVLLTYDNGKLIQAETRGNGEVGEIITHNAKVFENIPLQIDYISHLEIEGEAIITYDDFERINAPLPEDDKYKNPRNLVSGSVRQLDSNVAAQRHIKFIAWKVPTKILFNDEFINNNPFLQRLNFGVNFNRSFLYKLKFIKSLGFEIVPFYTYTNNSTDKGNLSKIIKSLQHKAKEENYPIDGLVMTYDDIEYGESLGMTGHHPKHSIAFKFYDEEVETTLLDIEWSCGKTGQLTPVAVFTPVEIDGTIIERASLHNISIIEELGICAKYQRINICKANKIIPQVVSAEKLPINGLKYFDDFSKKFFVEDNVSVQCYHGKKQLIIPDTCPICGGETKIKEDNKTKVLICTNQRCKGKLLGKLTHFVSKNAMNIDGLSEATLEKFIDEGFIESFIDIYELKNGFYNDIVNLEGFGKLSADKLMDAIEKSKNTTLDRFINALSIPLIGKTASKSISKYFNGNFELFSKYGCNFDYSSIDDFGLTTSQSITDYLKNNITEVRELASYMNFEKPETVSNTNAVDLSGKIFVITGSLNHFTNRDEAKDKIESLGGKVAGSVSKKTTYLVNNDINSTSGKNKKAKELNIPIITEEELLDFFKKNS